MGTSEERSAISPSPSTESASSHEQGMILEVLPGEIICAIMRTLDNVRDMVAFAHTCSRARALLRSERTLWSAFCPHEREDDACMEVAVKYFKLQREFSKISCRAKPATFFYRPSSIDGQNIGIPACHRTTISEASTSFPPVCLQYLHLGSIPCEYMPYLTFTGSRFVRGKEKLMFLVYCEHRKQCIYEAEFATDGRVISAHSNSALLDLDEVMQSFGKLWKGSHAATLLTIIKRVLELNEVRSLLLEKLAVTDGDTRDVQSLVRECGLKAKFLPKGHVLTASPGSGTPSYSVVFLVGIQQSQTRRTANLGSLFAICEQVKALKTYIETIPRGATYKIVIRCNSFKDRRQYHRVIQSMVDHSFLLNPSIERVDA